MMKTKSKNILTTIPVLDLSLMRSGNLQEKRTLARELDQICRDIGFFTVINHGIDPSVITDVYAAAKQFFNSPLPLKNQCREEANGPSHMINIAVPLGYSGLLEENVYAFMGQKNKPNDCVEKFSICREVMDGKVSCPFPKNDFGKMFQAKIYAYFEACDFLIKQLLELFTIALDLPTNFFDERVTGSNDGMRLLCYPPYTKEYAKYPAMAAHTDADLITLLTSTCPGIRIRDRAGQWIDPTITHLDQFLVNIGDVMMRWSNDTYVSTPHKVVLSEQQRISIVFFKKAHDDVVIKPFPKFCIHGQAKYEPIVYGDFLREKSKRAFRKKGINSNSNSNLKNKAK